MNTITHLRRLLARPVGRAASSIGDGHVMSGKGAWVVAVCAIGLSITGSATAAKLITGQQIKNSSLTGRDVKNGSLAAADLSRSARAALKGDVGPAGASGAVGPNGEAGAPGLKGETGEKGEAGKSVVADGSRIEPGVADIELKPGDDFKTILSTKLTSPDSGLLLGSGAVEVATADAEQGTAVVSLRIVHNGHAHFVPSTTSVTPGSRQTLVSSFQCDLMPGAQDVQLQARVTGAPVTVGGRTADIVSATQGQ